MNYNDKIDVLLKTRVDQSDRVSIYIKIQQGYDLTRDDLHMILRSLEDGITSEWAKKIIKIDELPKRIKGYKVKGSGRKTSRNTLLNDMSIALDYHDLINGEHFFIPGKYSSYDAIQLLTDNSVDLYGRSLGSDAIKNFITRGRKLTKSR